ncbi:MAG: hypothetical protein RIB47_03635 [Cyclobacteriaceae bacterium]
MKYLFMIIFLSCLSFSASAQKEKKIKSKKVTKVEAADMTTEQKLVHESERKSKKNKPVSMQKKVKIAKKQNKSGRKTKSPKPKKRKN